ncbi:MAG: glycoside hydrolase family 3 N-terminal domain-containing protein [Pseudomonadota bacterium]
MRPFSACILDPAGTRLTPDEKAFFRDANPFGFILFARSIETPDQTRALCAELREAVGREALITIDQEGGRVQRMGAPHWRQWPAPLDMVEQAGAAAPRAAYLMYRIIADELRRAGVDSNCAPSLDVARPDTHPFLRNRCFGSDPAHVGEIGAAVAQGLLDGGVVPVIKHMPGHGRSVVDTHFDLPVVREKPEVLRMDDFAPFRALAHLPMAMTAHLVFREIDAQPVTLSAPMVQLMREDLGFDGLLMTDDISMKALDGTPWENAVKALAAGVDVALFCNGSLADRIKVAQAAGEMPPTSMARAQAALDARKTPMDVDIPALEAEFEAALGGALHG